MSQNDDYFEFLERQFPQEKSQLSEDTTPSPQAKDKGLKILVMSLIGLISLVLLIFVSKSIVEIIIWLVCLAVLIGLFAAASEKKGE